MKRALLIAAAVASVLIAQLAVRPAALAQRDDWPKLDTQKSILLKHAHPILGREVTADILWAQTLVYYATATSEGEGFRYLEPFLDAILAIDPRFKRVYHWAAYAVTYLGDRATEEELLTSLKYLHMAIEQYPDDHKYLWIAGSRYYLDLDPEDEARKQMYRERGADMLERAMRKPTAPASYANIAAAWRYKLGQHERAVQNLKEKILTAKDAEGREMLLNKMRESYKKPDMADELQDVIVDVQAAWDRTLPYGPPELFFILGERPSGVIEFDNLATERDLFGVDMN